MKTATAARPPKPPSKADAARAIDSAPVGLPDPEAVERIRGLQRQISACENASATLRPAADKANQFFREQVCSRLRGTFFADTPVEALWSEYLRQIEEMGEIGYALADLKESHGLHEVAKQAVAAKAAEKQSLLKDLEDALNSETPKLAVVLKERAETVRLAAVAALEPFCETHAEAEAMADQTFAVQELALAAFYTQFSAANSVPERTSRFLNAWTVFNRAPAVPTS